MLLYITQKAILLYIMNINRSQNDFNQAKIGAASAGIGIAGAIVAEKLGIIDTQFIPNSPVEPRIVDGMVFVNEAIRYVSPSVMLGTIAAGAMNKFNTSMENRAATSLSKIDYSGLDDLNGEKESGRVKTFGRKWIPKGIGVAALTVCVAGTASGVENEISNGPLRPIEAMIDGVVQDDEKDIAIVLQSEKTTFMDDSFITISQLETVQTEANAQDLTMVPFGKYLPTIEGRSGILVSLPDGIYESASGDTVESGCINPTAIVDSTSGVSTGNELDINNITFEVADVTEDGAQMNRDFAITAQSYVDDCITDGEDVVFGAILSGEDTTPIQQMEFTNAEVISEDAFMDNNREFWRKNGTPILLQMIGYVGLLSGIAVANERMSAFKRNTRELGALSAQGVKNKMFKKIELKRAMRDTNIAALMAMPAMPVVAGVFNAAEFGLKVGVGLREVAVGYSVALGGKVLGNARAASKTLKNLDVSKAVRGS